MEDASNCSGMKEGLSQKKLPDMKESSTKEGCGQVLCCVGRDRCWGYLTTAGKWVTKRLS